MSDEISQPNGSGASCDRSKRPRIAITLGDANGVGPEVVIKSLLDARLARFVQPIIVGSAHVLNVHASKLGYTDIRIQVVSKLPDCVKPGEIVILDITNGEKPDVRFGEISAESGKLAMKSVEHATDLCIQGNVDGMVTAPISKEAISLAGYKDPGHTEFIARRTGCDD